MLADIELAQTLQAAPEEIKKVEEVPHPLDRDYQLLKCQLQLLDPEMPEYKVGRAPQRSRASSGHCSSACLPSRCPEGSLALGLLSLCLQALRRALGLGDTRRLVHMSLALDTQLLLSLQVIHAYLKQTSNSCRPPALQHVWKVDREGEVRESPPITTTFSQREMALAYPLLRE